MSRTYELACRDCKKTLWIGQGWPDHKTEKPHLYKADKYMKALEKFLFDHQEHNLVFGDDERLETEDYKEIEVE